MSFTLKSDFKPDGDQPQAIAKLSSAIEANAKEQTLLGVTGSGKTFTIANVIEKVQKPTLILSHNKTLAAQLFAEFKEFFPDNSVEYFISYYDYYQPEAYVAQRDLYIEKETDINQDIERYRNAAMQSLLSKKDVIVVASVSCIYGIGDPQDYTALAREVKVGQDYPREKLLGHLTDMQYYRSEYDFYSGLFRVRGDVVDIYLVSEEEALRIEYFGDEIESLKIINPISGEIKSKPTQYTIFPAKQYVTPYERIKKVTPQIREDLQKEKQAFLDRGRVLEATRLEQRVNYDLELLEEVGFVAGIENYSRYLDGRKPGTPPSTLLDYFGEDWLLVVDESHMTIPQVRGMYNGDRARKQNLVDYGFRLQAALDNRPLKFHEFEKKLKQVVYVSATPAEYEVTSSRETMQGLKQKNGQTAHDGVVEQIIRPTGLLDPIIEIKPSTEKTQQNLIESLRKNGFGEDANLLQKYEATRQIDDLLQQINSMVKENKRVLVTTLTKRMSEELTTFLEEYNIKVQYLHSDIDAIERVEILRNLRLGKIEVIVGINLLREGLDLPEVGLVAILDADKEGFLRSNISFIQTIGRAARNQEGRVIMYADKVTGSMKSAIEETRRRRQIQQEYNKKHGIEPTTIKSKIKTQLEKQVEEKEEEKSKTSSIERKMQIYNTVKPAEQAKIRKDLKVKMELLADALEFEAAAKIRDFLEEI
jgi:excinuclease ABC subunit B